MSRAIRIVQRVGITAIATGMFVLACRAATPGEAPPMGPRPEPIEPNPTKVPVPGAPDPIDPPTPMDDAGVSSSPTSAVYIPPVELGADPKPAPKQSVDAGVSIVDGGSQLPPVTDALPADANRRAE